jgi:carbon-monoxide dehydrogenase large subunit
MASIETCGCVASWDKAQAEGYDSAGAARHRTVFALVAGPVGLSEERIRIISPDIGGGLAARCRSTPAT